MRIEEAEKYYKDTTVINKSELGLDRMNKLMEKLGSVQDQLKIIHVAGTNGKGSTASFISEILMASGYKVGSYTSPSLVRYNERIRIDRDEIKDEEVVEYIKRINASGVVATRFEVETAMAYLYFYEQKCDFAVIEVGLGGRFDATNVVKQPEISVITSISFDHMDLLGDTIEKIAFEKAGIIKKNSDVVLSKQSREAENVIRRVCAEKGSALWVTAPEETTLVGYDQEKQTFNYRWVQNIQIAMLGTYQVGNAVTAIEVCLNLRDKGYAITEKTMREGLKNTKWSGRFEKILNDPVFLIDGGHNTEGAMVLRESIDRYYKDHPIIFIVGICRDKEYRKMLSMIQKNAKFFIVIEEVYERILSAVEMKKVLEEMGHTVFVKKNIEEAVSFALSSAEGNDIICACGSLYYIGYVKECIIGKN